MAYCDVVIAGPTIKEYCFSSWRTPCHCIERETCREHEC